MTDLSAFPITKRWPASHPDRLQLYSLPTPNGVKVSIILEEIGLPYEVHLVDFRQGRAEDAQRSTDPYTQPLRQRFPCILDPAGPGGQTAGALFRSGAILIYLAEKTGKFLPADPARRYETLQWLFFQMAAMGPMFGQRSAISTNSPDARSKTSAPLHRYRDEAKRILAIIEARLADRTWIMGDDYAIADISMLGWVRNLIGFYDAGELVDFKALKHTPAWLERGLARPAVQRGLNIPARVNGSPHRQRLTVIGRFEAP